MDDWFYNETPVESIDERMEREFKSAWKLQRETTEKYRPPDKGILEAIYGKIIRANRKNIEPKTLYTSPELLQEIKIEANGNSAAIEVKEEEFYVFGLRVVVVYERGHLEVC